MPDPSCWYRLGRSVVVAAAVWSPGLLVGLSPGLLAAEDLTPATPPIATDRTTASAAIAMVGAFPARPPLPDAATATALTTAEDRVLASHRAAIGFVVVADRPAATGRLVRALIAVAATRVRRGDAAGALPLLTEARTALAMADDPALVPVVAAWTDQATALAAVTPALTATARPARQAVLAACAWADPAAAVAIAGGEAPRHLAMDLDGLSAESLREQQQWYAKAARGGADAATRAGAAEAERVILGTLIPRGLTRPGLTTTDDLARMAALCRQHDADGFVGPIILPATVRDLTAEAWPGFAPGADGPTIAVGAAATTLRFPVVVPPCFEAQIALSVADDGAGGPAARVPQTGLSIRVPVGRGQSTVVRLGATVRGPALRWDFGPAPHAPDGDWLTAGTNARKQSFAPATPILVTVRVFRAEAAVAVVVAINDLPAFSTTGTLPDGPADAPAALELMLPVGPPRVLTLHRLRLRALGPGACR